MPQQTFINAPTKRDVRFTHPVMGAIIVKTVNVTGQGQIRLNTEQALQIANAWANATTEGDTVRSVTTTPSGDIGFILHTDAELSIDYWETDETLGVFLTKDAPLDTLASEYAPDPWPILQSIIGIVTDHSEPGVVWKHDAIVDALAAAGLVVDDTDGVRVLK